MQSFIKLLKGMPISHLILYIVISGLLIVILAIAIYEVIMWQCYESCCLREQQEANYVPQTDSTRPAQSGSTDTGGRRRKRQLNKESQLRKDKSVNQNKLSSVLNAKNMSFGGT